MLISNLVATQQVLRRLYQRAQACKEPYLVFDTETRAISPYPSEDALTIGRAQVTFWSVCLNGEAYSFPTHNYSAEFPEAATSLQCLESFWSNPRITVVAHNWNYDGNVLWFQSTLPVKSNVWCTQIGSWAAAEYLETSLKDRAPVLGRFLRATSTVDFTDVREVARYAEQDVLATEELYLLQRYGGFTRSPTIVYYDNTRQPNPLYTPTEGFFQEPTQTLSPFMRQWYTLLELPVLLATMRAEQRGIPFDATHLAEHIRPKVLTAVKTALEAVMAQAGVRFNPNSSQQLAAVVQRLGINYPFTTAKGAPSFKEDCLVRMQGTHPFFDAVLAYRKLVKMATTYVGADDTAGLNRWLNQFTGRIHCTIGTVNAVTGRSSASRPNLQQIPARKDVFELRKCFTGTAKGLNLVPRFRTRWSLGVLDHGQLELRVMTLYAKDPTMTKVLRDPKGDIHNTTAERFGIARTPAKNINFLLLFGGQYRLLANELTRFGTPTSEATAQEYCEQYERVYPGVVQQRLAWVQEHQRNGRIKLLFGRTRTLPFADFSNDYGIHRAETRLANNAVQGAGQDFLKAFLVRADPYAIEPDDAILRTNLVPNRWYKAYLADRKREVRRLRKLFWRTRTQFLIQVHDEAIFRMCPSAEAEVMPALADLMSWFHYFPSSRGYCVPLVAEGAVADNWAVAKGKKQARFPTSCGFEHWQQFSELH